MYKIFFEFFKYYLLYNLIRACYSEYAKQIKLFSLTLTIIQNKVLYCRTKNLKTDQNVPKFI